MVDLELAARLQQVLDGPHHEMRESVRKRLTGIDWSAADGLPRDDYRDLVLAWCRELADAGVGARSFPQEYGGVDDPGGRIAAFQTQGPPGPSALGENGGA